jgi:hypothetical protein
MRMGDPGGKNIISLCILKFENVLKVENILNSPILRLGNFLENSQSFMMAGLALLFQQLLNIFIFLAVTCE